MSMRLAAVDSAGEREESLNRVIRSSREIVLFPVPSSWAISGAGAKLTEPLARVATPFTQNSMKTPNSIAPFCTAPLMTSATSRSRRCDQRAPSSFDQPSMTGRVTASGSAITVPADTSRA